MAQLFGVFRIGEENSREIFLLFEMTMKLVHKRVRVLVEEFRWMKWAWKKRDVNEIFLQNFFLSLDELSVEEDCVGLAIKEIVSLVGYFMN